MPRIAFQHKYGDTFYAEGTAYLTDGVTRRDLTNCILRSVWKHVDTGYTVEALITVTDAEDGIYDIDLTAAQMRVPIGVYAIDVSVTEGDVTSTATIYAEILEAVTNAA